MAPARSTNRNSLHDGSLVWMAVHTSVVSARVVGPGPPPVSGGPFGATACRPDLRRIGVSRLTVVALAQRQSKLTTGAMGLPGAGGWTLGSEHNGHSRRVEVRFSGSERPALSTWCLASPTSAPFAERASSARRPSFRAPEGSDRENRFFVRATAEARYCRSA